MTNGAVRILLLGTFEVSVDGRDLGHDAWQSRRAAELVQLLALADGHELMRDQVIEALWPHLDGNAGAANLRKAAHHARRTFGADDAIVLRGGRVSLLPASDVSTDAAEFEAAAQDAARTGDARAARAAADAYPGELLPAARYEDWTMDSREHLRTRYLEMLRLSGRWQELAEADPTNEEASRALMRDAWAAGNRHAAIAHYGRLRATLRTELGVLPSEETTAVYEECLAGIEDADMRFVGRELELARIDARLRGTADGEKDVIAVRGPAGIGKSTFCAQVQHRAAEEGWRTVVVEAGLAEGPYSVLGSAIDDLVTGDPSLVEPLGDRGRSILGEITLLATSGDDLDEPVTRHQVVGATRRLLGVAAADKGVVLIVDDAHASDEATLDVLVHLGTVGSAPILIVLAYRPASAPEPLAHGLSRLARAGRVVELELGPLERDEAAALVAGAGIRPGRVTEIVDLAKGNPFFVLELARTATADSPLRVGADLGDSITRRFVDLDDGTVAMLRRLAVSGNDLDLETVAALTGLSDPETFGLLDSALGAGVLVVVDGRYRFGHELVRQALGEAVPPHHRVAIHRDAARRLIEADGTPGLIARHWLEGRRPDLAVPWLLAAARHAVELGAFQDALAYVDPLLDREADHTEALLIRAESLDALGDPGALTAYGAAARAAGEAAANEITPRRALAQIKQGDPAGALETLARSNPATLEGRLAEALTLSGAAALGFGDPAVGTAKAGKARKLAFDSGDPTAVVTASWAHAAAAHARGELRDSVRVDLLQTHDLPSLAVNVFDGQLCITQRLLYGARPYSDVIEFADSLGAEAKRLGAARGQAFAKTIAGEAKLLSGRLDEAEADLDEGRRMHHAMSAPTGEAFSLQRLAEAAMLRNQPVQARALLDQALEIAEETDVGFHLFDRIYGTRIALATDTEQGLAELEEAEVSVRGPEETCPGCRITLAVPAGIAAARVGDLGRAAEYEKATTFLADVVMRLPAWYAAHDELRGHIACAEGDRDASSAHFTTAADTYRSAGQPFDEARCRNLATT